MNDDLHPDYPVGYKFTGNASHLERGSVLLGNWHHYAKIEGPRRDSFDSAGRLPMPTSGRVVIGNGMGQDICFGGGQIVARPTRGAMIFCMSWNPGNTLGKKDAACFAVDIARLVHALRERLPKVLGVAACEPVQYPPRSAEPGEGFVPGHPYFKHPNFSEEEELRLVFTDRRYDGFHACAPNTVEKLVIDLGPRPDIFTRVF